MGRFSLACAALLGAWTGCGNDLGFDPSANTGLPCDVVAFLSDRCQSCHGSPLAAGAPIRLMTYDDLMGTNAAGVSVAQRCLERMTKAGAQMPPAPALAATTAEVAMFQAWMAAGAPPGDCRGGGAFNGGVVCTSGSTWSGGNRESSLMHPGVACIQCHAASREGPRFTIAGTVYPTGHEPNDCNGATSATVEVTDAAGHVTNLPVNAAGNFSSSAAVPFPIQVAVVAGGKRRPMAGSPTSGDCNTCHTQDGASGAPGRIATP
jgi:hypothetical protein